MVFKVVHWVRSEAVLEREASVADQAGLEESFYHST
jgi:hypothetical protein